MIARPEDFAAATAFATVAQCLGSEDAGEGIEKRRDMRDLFLQEHARKIINRDLAPSGCE